MDVFNINQILTVALFLGALGLAWLFVMKNRGVIRPRLAQGRRMHLTEATAIGPNQRAMILQVDQREFLVVALKGAAPAITELGAVVAEVSA